MAGELLGNVEPVVELVGADKPAKEEAEEEAACVENPVADESSLEEPACVDNPVADEPTLLRKRQIKEQAKSSVKDAICKKLITLQQLSTFTQEELYFYFAFAAKVT